MSKADVSLAAVARLRSDLARYAELAGRLRRTLETDARVTREKADGVLRERIRDADASERALQSAIRENDLRLSQAREQDGAPVALIDLAPLDAAVDRARRALANARDCRRAIDVALADADGRIAAYDGAVGVVVAGATALLHRKYGDLQQYLAGASTLSGREGRGAGVAGEPLGGGPSAGGASSRALQLVAPPGAPPGVVTVPLGLVDDSGSSVSGPESFGKGFSIQDLEWAHDALLDVVLPTLARGGTVDDLRARDVAEGRVGTRSYADTWSGFFGDTAIRLAWKADRLEVKNGYHRIWVARRAGLESVVAKVVGHV